MNATLIDKMTREEKLRAMEALWDSLIHEGRDLASPEWHAELLRNRKASVDAGTARFVTLDDLKR